MAVGQLFSKPMEYFAWAEKLDASMKLDDLVLPTSSTADLQPVADKVSIKCVLSASYINLSVNNSILNIVVGITEPRDRMIARIREYMEPTVSNDAESDLGYEIQRLRFYQPIHYDFAGLR